LYVGLPTGYTIQGQTVVQATTNYNGYAQFNMQNINSGANASSDLILTADNGNANDTFVDLGIASSTYNYGSPYGIIRPNDGYLIAYGNTNTGGGNLIVMTGQTNDIVFATGGGDPSNEMVRFKNGVGLMLKNKPITFADATTQNTAASPAAFTQAAFAKANAAFAKANTGGSGGGGVTYTADINPPSANVNIGDQWYSTSEDILYEYINNGVTSNWVDTSSPVVSGITPPTRYISMIRPGAIVTPETGTIKYYPPKNINIISVIASLSTAPVLNLNFIVCKNGANTGSLYSMSTGQVQMTQQTTNISLNTTDYLTINFLSGTGASDLRVELEYYAV
jgi:hypothetical protein